MYVSCIRYDETMENPGTARTDERSGTDSQVGCSDSTSSTLENGTGSAGNPGRVPVEDRGVRAVLEIERGGFCPIDEFDGNVLDTDVRYQMGHCLAELKVLEQGDNSPSTRTFSSPICEHCPGVVFSRYGCIPRFLESEAGSFVVETHLDDVDTLSTLVAEIRERCQSVTLRSLSSNDRSDVIESCSIDLSSLTPKQREAISKAKDSGHYDLNSDTSLEDVAMQMGISTSALSQRLQRAEANIMAQLNCECDCWMESS